MTASLAERAVAATPSLAAAIRVVDSRHSIRQALGAVAFVDRTHPPPLNSDDVVDLHASNEVYILHDSTSHEPVGTGKK